MRPIWTFLTSRFNPVEVMLNRDGQMIVMFFVWGAYIYDRRTVTSPLFKEGGTYTDKGSGKMRKHRTRNIGPYSWVYLRRAKKGWPLAASLLLMLAVGYLLGGI
jgi:hypothetical protein